MGLGSHSPPHRLASRLRQYKTTIILNGLASCWNVRLSLRHPPSKLCRPDLATQLVLFSPSRLPPCLSVWLSLVPRPPAPPPQPRCTAPETTSTLLPTDLRSVPVLSCLDLSCLSPCRVYLLVKVSAISTRCNRRGERERKQEKKSKLEETSRPLSHFLRGASAWDSRREE